MLRSMTGYGRGQNSGDGFDFTVDVKSVNHRYFEFSSKIPKSFQFLEDKLKTLVQGTVSRGKIEVALSVTSAGGSEMEIAINEEVAQGYVKALRSVRTALDLQDDLKLSSLLRFPDLFTVKRVELDEKKVWETVAEAAKKALASFQTMREREGTQLREDLRGKISRIEALLAQVEARAPQLRQAYYDRLFQRLSEVLTDRNIEESRLVTEAALFADKVAVDEETVRLRSHLHQFALLLESEEPVGKKLDFLVQEMNRETNTIGSKAQDLQIARVVVDLKAEIEKMREQIQNIE